MRPDTILQWAADLMIRLKSSTSVVIETDGIECEHDAGVLSILHVFSTPKTFEAGVAEMSERTKGVMGWMELTGQVQRLYEQGVLQSSDEFDITIPSHASRFDGASVHVRMLNDVSRTSAYQAAIRSVVTPDDIVLDLGTGTGVFAATAVLAGARHVYAIERTGSMARVAQQLFEANGVADRVTILEGHSSQIELPEKADVMISELIGDDPLAEGVLSTTRDAKRRFLKPDARLIPQGMQIYALPVTVPDAVLSDHLFTEKNLKGWENRYGIDFEILGRIASNQSHAMKLNTQLTLDWLQLSTPIKLMDIDFSEGSEDTAETCCNVPITRTGVLNGIIVYFELDLSEGHSLSIHPDSASETNNWVSRIWIPGKPLKVTEGSALDLTYTFDHANGSQFTVDIK